MNLFNKKAKQMPVVHEPVQVIPVEMEAVEEPEPVMCPAHDLLIKPGESCPACRRELHVNKSWDD